MRLKAPVIKSIGSGGERKANVTWAAVPYATGYSIYRATSQNGIYAKVATVGNVTSYVDTVSGYSEYWYKVSGVCNAGTQYAGAKSAAVKYNSLPTPKLISVMAKSWYQPVILGG